MDTLDHLRQRLLNGAMELRNEMIAAGTDEELLPVGDITVEKTENGAIVEFTKKSVKKPKKAVKAIDES
jgi:hypothetical protein